MPGINRILSHNAPHIKTDVVDPDGLWFTKQLDIMLNDIKDTHGVSSRMFYASQLGNPCDRVLYLHYNGLLRQQKISAQLRRIFDHGHATEDRYAKYFERMRVLISREVSAKNTHPPIHGRADFILSFPGQQINRLVLELKTINNGGFVALQTPKLDHLIQIQVYLQLLGIEQGIVLYENKNTQGVKAFLCEKDNVIWERIVERCCRIQEMIKLPSLESIVLHDKSCLCLGVVDK